MRITPAGRLRQKLVLDTLREQGHEAIAETLEEQMDAGTVRCDYVSIDHGERPHSGRSHAEPPFNLSVSLVFVQADESREPREEES